jgi:hypothetical protein
LFLLVFILENRPFDKQTINFYCTKNDQVKFYSPRSEKLISSPSKKSKFSPNRFISNSPEVKKRGLKERIGLNILAQYSGTLNNSSSEKSIIANKSSSKGIIVEKKMQSNNSATSEKMTGEILEKKNSLFCKTNTSKALPNELVSDLRTKIENIEKNTCFTSCKDNKNIIFSRNEDISSMKNSSSEVPQIHQDIKSLEFEGYIYLLDEDKILKKWLFKLYNKYLFCK